MATTASVKVQPIAWLSNPTDARRVLVVRTDDDSLSDYVCAIYDNELYGMEHIPKILPTNLNRRLFFQLIRRFYPSRQKLSGAMLRQLVEMTVRYERCSPEKQKAILPPPETPVPAKPVPKEPKPEIYTRAQQLRQLRRAVEFFYAGAHGSNDAYVHDWADEVRYSYEKACCAQPTITKELEKFENVFVQLPSGRWVISLRGRMIDPVADEHSGMRLIHELISVGYLQHRKRKGESSDAIPAMSTATPKGFSVFNRIDGIRRKQIYRAISAIGKNDAAVGYFFNTACEYDQEKQLWQFKDEDGHPWQTELPAFKPDAALNKTASGWEFNVPWGWTDAPIRIPFGVRDTGLAHIQTALWLPNGMCVPCGLLGNRTLADVLAAVPAYRKLFSPIYPARFRRIVSGNPANSKLANAICEAMNLKRHRYYRATDMIDGSSELNEFIDTCCDMVLVPDGIAGVLKLLDRAMAGLVMERGNDDTIIRLRDLQTVLKKAINYLNPYEERLIEVGRGTSPARPKVTQAISEAIDYIESRGSSWMSPELKLADYLREHIHTGEFVRHNGPLVWSTSGMRPFPNLVDLFSDHISFKLTRLDEKRRKFSTAKSTILRNR